MAYPAVRPLPGKTPATSSARHGPYLLVRLRVRPERHRAQSCAIALRSPAPERSSDLKRYSPDIHNCNGPPERPRRVPLTFLCAHTRWRCFALLWLWNCRLLRPAHAMVARPMFTSVVSRHGSSDLFPMLVNRCVQHGSTVPM